MTSRPVSAAGMNAAIDDEALHGFASYFAAYGVEAGEQVVVERRQLVGEHVGGQRQRVPHFQVGDGDPELG